MYSKTELYNMTWKEAIKEIYRLQKQCQEDVAAIAQFWVCMLSSNSYTKGNILERKKR